MEIIYISKYLTNIYLLHFHTSIYLYIYIYQYTYTHTVAPKHVTITNSKVEHEVPHNF